MGRHTKEDSSLSTSSSNSSLSYSTSNRNATTDPENLSISSNSNNLSNDHSLKITFKTELIFLLFGTTVLYSYNTYINSIDYFQLLFPDDDSIATNIARVFNIANSMTFFLSVTFVEQFTIKARYYTSIIMECIVALFFFIYPNVSSPNIIVIYVFEAISAIFTGILFGTTMGFAGLFGGNCSTMAASGLALSGVTTAICRVLSKLMGKGEGWFYFGITFIVYACSFVAFIFFEKTDLAQEKIRNSKTSNNFCYRMKRFGKVMQKIWIFFVEAFLCMTITLTLFPGYATQTISKHGLSSDWVTTIITSMFMAGDFIGRLLTRWVTFPKPKYLFIPHFCRLLFFVLFCISIEGVAVQDDIWIYFMTFFLALTSGYYVTLCLSYTATSEKLDSEEVELGSFLASLGLNLGVFAGSWLTYAMPK
ncbi:Nucleoside transporter family protein [Tritrichomonas foetus]|uniref:Nucleoside transporter family protein n=1 Tax=Tritrichomonas foetus TaxID=1144522 RepID=A0A1J4JBV8_9EUKA|nr:Nucleoside transporter family protein [Tritrichomonas foetus]|eukprot:OHS96682.1 Nucleoside transporter family protein [Tritrichomonas foetus]